METNTKALLVLMVVVLFGCVAEGARELETYGDDEVYQQEKLFWSGLGGLGGKGSKGNGWLWGHRWWPWNWGSGTTPGVGVGPGVPGGLPGIGGGGPGLPGGLPGIGGGGLPGIGGGGPGIGPGMTAARFSDPIEPDLDALVREPIGRIDPARLEPIGRIDPARLEPTGRFEAARLEPTGRFEAARLRPPPGILAAKTEAARVSEPTRETEAATATATEAARKDP